MPFNKKPQSPSLSERAKANLPDWLRKVYEEGKTPDLKTAAEQVRKLARQFQVITSQFDDEDDVTYLLELLSHCVWGVDEPKFPEKQAKAAGGL